MISLEEAHWRLSALPAEVAGFRGRGVLKKGAPADIVVYDFDGLKVLPDEIAHDLPGGEWRRIQRAQGYKYVLVNGEVTIRNDGRPTNTHLPPAAPRRIISLPAKLGEGDLQGFEGSLMATRLICFRTTPPRFAGTSPSKTTGGKSDLIDKKGGPSRPPFAVWSSALRCGAVDRRSSRGRGRTAAAPGRWVVTCVDSAQSNARLLREQNFLVGQRRCAVRLANSVTVTSRLVRLRLACSLRAVAPLG